MQMINIVFCLPGRGFSNNFITSWTSLLLACPTFNVAPRVMSAYSNIIYRVRNLCLGGKIGGPVNQRPFGGKYDYDYIMWIDSDMVFEPSHFKSLLNRMEKNKNYQILAGTYKTENGKFAFRHENSQKRMGTKPFKVMFSGMGFMIVRRGVFEAITYPWIFPAIEEGKGRAPELTGDDFSFCHRIKKEANIDIWVDPDVVVGHEKSAVL